jgi:hypothetical protein
MTDSLQLEREATANRIRDLEAQVAERDAIIAALREAVELTASNTIAELLADREADRGAIRELTRENRLLKQEEQDA